MRIVLQITTIFVVTAVLITAVIFFRQPSIFPLHAVDVSASLSPKEKQLLVNTVRPLLKTSNFMTVDLETIKTALQQLPWVAQATVGRQWPDKIAIAIETQQAQARWRGGGLVDQYGEVFYSLTKQSSQLPTFDVPTSVSALKALSRYQQMSQLLTPLSLAITVLRQYPNQSWQITLNNGMKLQLGSAKPLTKLQHFVKVYPTVLAKSKKQAKVVDLRYKNGMAVQWGDRQ